MPKILRSVLFTPGELQKSFEKSMRGLADCIIFDLEDSVHPDKKDFARSALFGFLSSQLTSPSVLSSSSKRQKVIAIRVNCPFSSPWGNEDLYAIKQLTNLSTFSVDRPTLVHAIVIPKAQDLSSINALYIDQKICNQLPVWAMIETAKGVLNVESIASSNNVEALVFGSNDLSKDLQSKHVPSRQPLLYSMSKTILSARAHGKYVIDGVHLDIHDSNGLEETCQQGRELGFDGKSLIHPNQIEIANKCFSPSPEEILHAKKVIYDYEDSMKQGKGVCVVDNRLVEKLHVDQAQSILQIDSLINSL